MAIQEQFSGFIVEQVFDPKGELYYVIKNKYTYVIKNEYTYANMMEYVCIIYISTPIIYMCVLPTGTKGPLLSRLPDPPLLSRTGVPGWETGTTAVFQPGQINIFVVVSDPPRLIYGDRPAGRRGDVKDKLDGADRSTSYHHRIGLLLVLPLRPRPRPTSVDQSCAVPFAMCSACPSHE